LRLCTAVKYEVLLLIIIAIVLFGSYAGLRFAQLPLVANTCKFTDANNPAVFIPLNSTTTATHCVRTDEILTITVSFPIYVIALASWIGWFILILFLGSGLTALPIDLINQFRFRPIPMKEDEFNRTKSELAKQVEKLL
jgi:LMBR1 domain-containing protein 1